MCVSERGTESAAYRRRERERARESGKERERARERGRRELTVDNDRLCRLAVV